MIPSNGVPRGPFLIISRSVDPVSLCTSRLSGAVYRLILYADSPMVGLNLIRFSGFVCIDVGLVVASKSDSDSSRPQRRWRLENITFC